MEKIILKNKPLAEAIFELHWKLKEIQLGVKVDPYYKILVGRVYERINKEYPYYEQLPTATMPDEIAAYIVQYRFRKDRDRWPLVQIGPGVITLNDTEGYEWDDFEKRIFELVTVLFELYPDAENSLKLNTLLLRYIDAIKFDYEHEDIFPFLREKMKVNIDINKEIFAETGVGERPIEFDFRFSFPLAKPEGVIHMRVFKGKLHNSDAILLETAVNFAGESVPQEKEKIFNWIKTAHELTHKWFFKIIDGDLRRRFE
ncbi:MAG: TIGR04255 family protein [archaeon]